MLGPALMAGFVRRSWLLQSARAKRDWVSPFGVAAHPETLDIAARLGRSLNFEVVPMGQRSGVRYFVTREELEQQLKRILN